MKNKSHIFISGLHRSGTTFLADLIAKNENVSTFNNTGFPRDEGQFIQNLLPKNEKFILPGRFAFNPDSHLTEKSPLLQNKNILIDDWYRKWDLTKQFFLEKSPPNIIRTRFLQEVFPNSKFITIIRHPVAVSYATKKWTNDFFLEKLIRHWIKAHEIYLEDRKFLKNELIIYYEDFINSFETTLAKISNFLGIDIANEIEFINQNEFYFDLWRLNEYSGMKYFGKYVEKKYLIKKYEKKVNKFGYSLKELNQLQIDKLVIINLII